MPHMPLRLVSLNIEGKKHLAEVLSFLQAADADVVCLQEVFQDDLARFERELGVVSVFANMRQRPNTADHGNAILTKLPLASYQVLPYMTHDPAHPHFILGSEEERAVSQDFNLLVADIEYGGGESLRVITTHFPWSEEGRTTPFQRVALKNLLAQTDTLGEFVLCGDFNAPRGQEIFTELSARFKDNVPPRYESSIDPTKHRNPDIRLMVDGVFTTPGIAVTDVSMQGGISDHRALIGTLRPVLAADSAA